MRRNRGLIAALALALCAAAPSQPYQPPRHSGPGSPMLISGSPIDLLFRADAGTQIEQNRSPAGELEEHRKLDRVLKGLALQRAGTVDAYVVAIALDSDPVFGREARQAAAVLSRRYGAAGRTIVLAGSDGSGPSTLPRGSPGHLAVVLARLAELMNREEDALILYTTSHGAQWGLHYHDADNGFGAVSPNRLGGMLDDLQIHNRLLILSACYSGVFVKRLQTGSAAILTAAAADRTSFGCDAQNDWTFFGDALVNRALRKPQPLTAAYAEAAALIGGWESQGRMTPSLPQISVGANASRWLDPLEARVPKTASPPVGRSAFRPGAR
jgi:hypothetical protein